MTAPDTNTPGNGLTDADLLALAGECGARLARSLPVSLSEPQKVVDIQFLPAQFFSFARAIEAKIRAADRAADREARPAPATSNDTDTMAWQRQGVTLTAHQLAEAIMLASGETVTFSDPDMADSEVTIAYAPEGFVRDDDGKTEPAGYVAWLTDYPEEGCIPLTDPLAERAKEAFSTLAASTPPADRCRHGVRFPHECTECQEDTPPASEARATGDAAAYGSVADRAEKGKDAGQWGAATGAAGEPQPREGWKWVPVEPTPAMLEAGDQKTWVFPSRECWAVMLAAVPQADSGAAGGQGDSNAA